METKKTKTASRIWVPPQRIIDLPVRPRLQTLPLNELPWEIFQRLCARIAQRTGDVEFSQEYGVPGQSQEGIDIYVRIRSTGRYSIWQCKRYQKVSRSEIKTAVDQFIKGEWISKAEEFVICVSAPIEDRKIADEIEIQSQRLRDHKVALTPKGINQLSECLKEHPDLVDDYLGREWVREFCGQEAADRLSSRILNPAEVRRLRSLLLRSYTHHFESVDPGLPSLTNIIARGRQPLLLSKRFILPDVLESQQVNQVQQNMPETQTAHIAEGFPSAGVSNSSIPPSINFPIRIITTTTEVRRPALEWFLENDLSIIIGDPGIGKSSLLRYVLLDLLSEEPKHENLAIKWGNHLPVWVPFAMWTRMVAEDETRCSLADILKTWLTKVSAPVELVALVQQALNDSRLLLFVDGLDEWSNETAAHSTVALLEQFVGEREIPAIASSRPLGLERLGGLSGKWKRAKLAGLTSAQQHEFVYRWFLHQSFVSKGQNDKTQDKEEEKLAKSEAIEFFADIQRDGRLAKLAEVPLLLSGLITLSLQRVKLPQSRFKAYEELTRLLLQEQPQRREKAAHARVSSVGVSQGTRERALARLAYAVHQSPGSESIEKENAHNVLRDFLGTFLQKPLAETIELADQILSIGAETVGILVEKSPQEVGFPHRVFQEFLSARHLSNLSFEEQKELVANLFVHPQWHQVLLCLCHLNTRADEVDALVEVVQNASIRPEVEPARKNFLTEIAFSDLHCSAPVASRLGKQAFNDIEKCSWMVFRERLLELALDGLQSDILRKDTEDSIRCWYPNRHGYRGGVYKAMAAWPRESETVEALWRGLHDEEELNQRAAAEALAENFGGDNIIKERLFRDLHTSANASLATYILHALCLGWPHEQKLIKILEEARDATILGLRVNAISHRVNRREQDSKDREYLLDFATDRIGSDWRWREDAAEALIRGWPNDSQIKSMAIQGLSDRFISEKSIYGEIRGTVLMRGFPQDDEVAKAIADLFRQEEYPQHRLGLRTYWTPLVQSFERHPLVCKAVDDWLEKKKKRHLDWECCLISKSSLAKKLLLEPSEDTNVINEYQARWLLAGWGMSDREAALALRKMAESEVASKAAHLLPSIMSDKDACRERLLGWLRTSSDIVAQNALIGLIDLGCDEQDNEVLEPALEKFAGKTPSGVRWWGVSDV